MKEAEFEIIANKIADVLDNVNDDALHAKIKEEMKELASNFVIYDKPIY
jgi:glycine hydroxymethyltransferase